jgi:RNA polymerase sigma-70 factor (ECF subfamily)
MDDEQLRGFTDLYERHAEAVHRYASRRCDRDTAEEVVAQVFAVAWRRRQSIPEEALPWLYGVARRVLSEQRRGERRRRRLYERVRGERAAAPDHDAFAPAPDDAALSEALKLIPALDREALLLTYWEELSPAQVAEAMGCSRATLAVRLHRARRRLRSQIEAADEQRPRRQSHDRSCITETEST